MLPRLSIIAGLLAGVAAAALVLGGLLFLTPGPSLAPPSDDPTATPSTPSPVPSSPLPTATPSAEPTASADASASTDPSGSVAALFHIGEPAPALVVPRVGGGTIDLAALKGQPVWVNFMATWCPPCQDEFPLMNGFAARHADDGLVVVAVDVKEDEPTVAAFVEGLHATFPTGLDGDGTAADTWKAAVLPVHFWIDRDGIVRDGAAGGIGPDIMARGVSAILPGVEVTP